MIELQLPYPPSVNAYWQHRGRGTFISKRGEAFRDETILAVRQKYGRVKPLAGPVAVQVAVFPPDDHRKHDLDNLLKPILDSLQKAGVFEDDEQVTHIDIRRSMAIPEGGLWLSVSEDAAFDGASLRPIPDAIRSGA